MIINRETLVSLGACYVAADHAADHPIVVRLPATLAAIVECADVPIADAVWLVGRVAPRLVARWAVWCARRALRHAGAYRASLLNALRLTRHDPHAATRAATRAAKRVLRAAARVEWGAWELEDAAVLAARAAERATRAAEQSATRATDAAARTTRAAEAAAWAAEAAAQVAAEAGERARQRAALVRFVRASE